MKKKRILAVANRLPVSINIDGDKIEYNASPGGLASALSSLKESHEDHWIGWPGEVDLTQIGKERIESDLDKKLNAHPIFLDRRQLNRYYFGFSNKVLWPTLHYLPNRIDYDERDFLAYREVNRLFADAIIKKMQDGEEDDLIWIHDYQLFLVPSMVRAALPAAKIGFFLHTPFPSSELFRALPYREELLRGIIGSTLVGFQTFADARHFRSSLLYLLDIEAEMNHVTLESHELKFGPYPISIDTGRIDSILESPEIEQHKQIVRKMIKGRRLILSVDRLDYTKGLPDRLRAYKKFLQKHPHLAKELVLIQVAVPTRTRITDYQKLKDEVEAIVLEIEESFESETDSPIEFLYKSLPFDRLCALYDEAEICMVTPYFDGMNLVAKEFVAVKKRSGMLILSEHAGAHSELGEAISVNPWNSDQISQALEYALDMSPEERERRMGAMYEKIKRNDVFFWSKNFLEELSEIPLHDPDGPSHTILLNQGDVEKIVAQFFNARSPLVITDYDGTLAELTNLPLKAKPDRELIALLHELARDDHSTFALISGRPRSTLDAWLGDIPAILSAEHGLWLRLPSNREWQRTLPEDYDSSWINDVKAIFEQFNLKTPGSYTEVKEASIAWHYRLSDPNFGRWQARELRMHLNNLLANHPLEVLSGKSVVEVRTLGVHKGTLLQRLEELEEVPSSDFVLAIGDDQTDEDLFAALPESAVSIKVGRGVSHAKYRMRSVSEVRELLSRLARGR